MNTGEFLDLLNQNEGKELVFEYKQNEFVPAAYHITEIKSKHINSVDCGGIAHSYDETVVQLWISGEEEKSRAMEAEKALKKNSRSKTSKWKKRKTKNSSHKRKRSRST